MRAMGACWIAVVMFAVGCNSSSSPPPSTWAFVASYSVLENPFAARDNAP